MMELFKIYFLAGIINIATAIYLQKKLLNKKINFKSPKLYIIFIIASILLVLNSIFVTGFIRFIISTFIATFMCYFIFAEDLSRSFTVAVLQQIILFLSEMIFSIILAVLKINLSEMLANMTVIFCIMNCTISIISILFYKIKYVSSFFAKVMQYLDKIEDNKKSLLMLLFIITLNVLLMTIYFRSENKFVIIINTIFVIIYSGIVYLLFNEKTENIKFKNENKMLVDNLNEYERMLDYQRISNHENKNQLAVIKGMIHKNNHKALDYINTIINETRPANESLFTQTKRIPSGGLQGLIYQKMLVMQEKDIKVDLQVSRNIKKINFSKMTAKTNFDLCRIIGILLDNAIDEVEKLEQKELSISMFNDNEIFVIEIANCFKDTIDLEKIDEKGYTTKSKGHGYGLSLLKDIVSKNEAIVNERMITKDIFIQIVKIKM